VSKGVNREDIPVGACRFSHLPKKWQALLLQGKAKQIGEVVATDSDYIALFIWSICVAIAFFVVAKLSAPEIIQWFFSKSLWQHAQAFFSSDNDWPADLFVSFLLLLLFSVAVFGFGEMLFHITDKFLRSLGYERYGLILGKDHLIVRLPGDVWINDACLCIARDNFKESRIVRRGKDPSTEINLAYFDTNGELSSYTISKWFDHKRKLNAKINTWKFQPGRYRNIEGRIEHVPPIIPQGVRKLLQRFQFLSPPFISLSWILLMISRTPRNFFYLGYLLMLLSFFMYYGL